MTPTILVVDDEPDLEALVQQKFRRQIRDGQVRFLFARDGAEALDVLGDRGTVDMVVSDINMPRMDGLTLLQKIQEADDQLSTVIVSAYGDMANIRTAMNRGAFDFLTKPIDFADLEATINKTLRHIERHNLFCDPLAGNAAAVVTTMPGIDNDSHIFRRAAGLRCGLQ